MALKFLAKEELNLKSKRIKNLPAVVVGRQPARLIAFGPSSSFGLSTLATFTISLIIIVSIATVITPTKSNPLNSHSLLHQVAKPFLIQRERKFANSSLSTSSGTNMKFKPTSSPSASSSTPISRNLQQQKRPIIGGIPANLAGPLKLFKASDITTATRPSTNGSISSQSFAETLNALGSAVGPEQFSAFQMAGSRGTNGSDLNNDAANIASHDINNNTIQTGLFESQHINRNVNSVNGTIDLSLYANSDVDRLYGDALLVYLKNFNETLPARKDTINLNGTLVPTYRSASRVARVPRWE